MVWDERLKGFGVRINPTGTKTYVARYRAGGGHSGPITEFVVGRHGTITADQARTDATRILADATRGLDPQADRAKKRADMTVAQLCDRYLAEGCATKKPSTISTDRGRIARHIKPLLGSKRLLAVTSADIEKFRDDVAAGKTAITEKTGKRGRAVVRGGRGTATRTLGLLGAIFAFAAAPGRKFRGDNPVLGVARFKGQRMQRFLDAAELKRLGAALDAADAEQPKPHGVAVIRLLFLTGARKSEIEGLRWTEVDSDWGCLRLPDSKTGAKVVPVGAAVLAVLNDLPRSNSSPFVFPAKGDPGRHYSGTPKVWSKVRAAAGLSNVRLHDARHTLASLAVGGGQSLPMIGAMLGHKDIRTTAQYAHLAAAPLRAMADSVSKGVADLMAAHKDVD